MKRPARRRGMVLFDSLLALLALGIGLAPLSVLQADIARTQAEHRYRSWALWLNASLGEALYLAGADQYQTLVKDYVPRETEPAVCLEPHFIWRSQAALGDLAGSRQLTTQFHCHGRRYRIETLHFSKN